MLNKGRMGSQSNKVPAVPVNVRKWIAPRGMCSHVFAAMQGSSADPMPTFLTLAVHLEEREEHLRKEDRKGRGFENAQNGHTTAWFSELYLQMVSAVLPIQPHVLKHSDCSKVLHREW